VGVAVDQARRDQLVSVVRQRRADDGDTAIANGDIDKVVFTVGESGICEKDRVWHVVPLVHFQLCIF
jgi:hypothetical protein